MMVNAANAGTGSTDRAAVLGPRSGLLNRRSFLFGSAFSVGALSLAGCVTQDGMSVAEASKLVMFAAFFAAYAVLAANTAGGPKAAELFDVRNAAAETACLLVSSFTCGLATIAARARNTT